MNRHLDHHRGRAQTRSTLCLPLCLSPSLNFFTFAIQLKVATENGTRRSRTREEGPRCHVVRVWWPASKRIYKKVRVTYGIKVSSLYHSHSLSPSLSPSLSISLSLINIPYLYLYIYKLRSAMILADVASASCSCCSCCCY